LSNPLVLLGCATFIAIIVLEKMKVKGNIIIGILVFSIIAWATGLAKFNGIASSPPPMTYLFDFDLSAAMTAGMSTVIFTLLFIDFFDTAGTLTSVANVAGKVDKDGKVKDINKAMLADSVGTVAGAMMGTTTVTSYVESGAGVKAGGKTGMTSLVIGLLFLACIFFAPLATSLPKQIDGAALLFVSVLFIRNITDIEWDDISEAAPAILAMIAMPLTYSISNGIALAFVSYALIKLFTGKFSSTSPAILAMIAMPLTYSISNGIALAFVSYALIKLFTGKFSTTSPAIFIIAILSVISFAVA
jgi:AGZA family xanthine/uracil permease-like MFS transporter